MKMFTLKLYDNRNGQRLTKILAVDHVTTMVIGAEKQTLEVHAFWDRNLGYDSGDYYTFYVGKKEDGMEALNEGNHFGWGLLENSHGKTTQHFRPYSYGP